MTGWNAWQSLCVSSEDETFGEFLGRLPCFGMDGLLASGEKSNNLFL